MYRIKKVTIPTQVIHRENELPVPFTQGPEFYVALSRLGVPTEMIVYPRTPHRPREPKHLMDVTPRILTWYEHHLGRTGPEYTHDSSAPEPLAGAMRIEDATFVVVDTETTGFDHRTDRLIEIAAVELRAGRATAEFSELVRPDRTVPRRITALTGITNAMVGGAHPPGAVLPRFQAFLGRGVFVAHHMSFDRSFVNAELERAGLPRMRNPMLCTARLARRLLRGLPSKGLDSVVGFFGFTVEERHRALSDARVTAKVLLRFLDTARREHGVTTVEELLRFQFRAFRAVRPPAPHVRDIRARILPRLPACPGVYFMKGNEGRIIYAGKARNLRSRVGSYFTGIEGHPARTRDLVAAVRDVAWTETETELEALLLESRTIKSLRPRFNRAERRWADRPFVRLVSGPEAPRISVSAYIHNDGAEYWGPFRSRERAESAVDIALDLYGRGADAPRAGAGKGGELSAQGAEAARKFLAGHDRTILGRLDERMRAAAERTDYEQAAEWRDRLLKLDWMERADPLAAVSVFERNAAVVDPSGGRTHVLFIRHGRFEDSLAVARPPSASDRVALLERVRSLFPEAPQAPARFLEREVDEVRLAVQWMHKARARIRIEVWRRGRAPDEFVRAVMEHCARPTFDS